MTYYQNWSLDKNDVSGLYVGDMDRWAQIKNSGALNSSGGSAIATIFSNVLIAGAGKHDNNCLDDFSASLYLTEMYRSRFDEMVCNGARMI